MNKQSTELRYLRWYGYTLGILFITLERNRKVIESFCMLAETVIFCSISTIIGAIPFLYFDVAIEANSISILYVIFFAVGILIMAGLGVGGGIVVVLFQQGKTVLLGYEDVADDYSQKIKGDLP